MIDEYRSIRFTVSKPCGVDAQPGRDDHDFFMGIGRVRNFVCWGRVVRYYRVRKSLAEQDGELVGSLFPGPLRHLPIFFNIAHGQEQQFGRCLVTGEAATILNYFP